jgi:hypothetical protein
MYKYLMFFLIYFCSCNFEKERGGKVGKVVISESKKALGELYYDEVILDKIAIKIPEELSRMTNQMLEEKYPSNVRPPIAFCNADASATFSFNSVPQSLKEGEFKALLPVMIQQFEKVYPDIKWYSKKMVEVNSKSFIECEFVSSSNGKDIYNLVYLAGIDDSLFISTFNCIANQKKEWEVKARNSMASIKEIKR